MYPYSETLHLLLESLEIKNTDNFSFVFWQSINDSSFVHSILIEKSLFFFLSLFHFFSLSLYLSFSTCLELIYWQLCLNLQTSGMALLSKIWKWIKNSLKLKNLWRQSECQKSSSDIYGCICNVIRLTPVSRSQINSANHSTDITLQIIPEKYSRKK